MVSLWHRAARRRRGSRLGPECRNRLNRRHDHVEHQRHDGSKKTSRNRGLERQSGSNHHSAAEHGAGIDQEIEHDAEKIEPANGLALFRDRFDPELFDAGGLAVARAQIALDVVCGCHGFPMDALLFNGFPFLCVGLYGSRGHQCGTRASVVFAVLTPSGRSGY
jgi:hypothetical protein